MLPTMVMQLEEVYGALMKNTLKGDQGCQTFRCENSILPGPKVPPFLVTGLIFTYCLKLTIAYTYSVWVLPLLLQRSRFLDQCPLQVKNNRTIVLALFINIIVSSSNIFQATVNMRLTLLLLNHYPAFNQLVKNIFAK